MAVDMQTMWVGMLLVGKRAHAVPTLDEHSPLLGSKLTDARLNLSPHQVSDIVSTSNSSC